MVSPDSTSEERKSSFSEESQKTIYNRYPAPHQGSPALSLSKSKSDDEVDTLLTPPPKTDHQRKRGKKKEKQPSNKISFSDESENTLHRRFPDPRQATPAALPLSESKSDDEEEQEAKEEEGEDEPQSKNLVAINAAANDLAKPTTESGQPIQEMDAMMNATVIKVKEYLFKTTAMIQDFINTRTDHLQLPNRGRINMFHSANGAPLLSSEKLEALQQKWREQHIREREACSRRLDLLQEECQISLEEHQAAVRSGRY